MQSCRKPHHSLLHQDPLEAVSLICKGSLGKGVRFGILPFFIEGDKSGIVVYAMWDNGSDTSLIGQSLVDRLGLIGKPTKLNLATAIGNKLHNCIEVSLTVLSTDGKETLDMPKIYTVPKVLGMKITPHHSDDLLR